MSLLFYNHNSGLSQLYNTDGQGGITQLNSYSFVRTTWTHIVPCYEGYYTILLFYDNRSGIAEFYRIDEYGNLSQLSSTTYSPDWTHVIPFPTPGAPDNELLFYNSTSGLAQKYITDGLGGINQLSSTTYSTGWTHILGDNFTDELSASALFFYNSASGLGQFYYIDRQGDIHQVSSTTYSKWAGPILQNGWQGWYTTALQRDLFHWLDAYR